MNSSRRIYITMVSGSFSLLVVLAILSGCVPTPPDRVPIGQEYELQAFLESSSNDQWAIAKSDRETDWEVYFAIDYISDIAADENDIWAATNAGLLRVERDTGNLIQYMVPYFPLPSNDLSDLLLHEGTLYISGDHGLAIYDRQNTWTLYTADEIGLVWGWTTPLALVDGVIWIGGENGIAQLFPDGHWEVVRAGWRTFPEGTIRKITPCNNTVCLEREVAPQSLERITVCLEDGKWKETDSSACQFIEGPEGNLWKRDADRLYKSTDQGLNWQLMLETDRYVELHAFDSIGRAYLSGGDHEILVLEGEQVVEAYATETLMPELHYINIIEWDARERLWIATDGRGMTMYDGEQWHNWQDGIDGMRQDAVRGLAIGKDKLYAGTHSSAGTGGVNVFDFEINQWTSYWPGESELSGGGVDGIAIDSQDRVYFPTAAGILDIYDGKTWKHVDIPIPGDRYTTGNSEAVFDSQGNYWVGIEGFMFDGLWRYDGQNWSIYDIGSVEALATDPEGRLWIGLRDGFAMRDLDTSWHFYAIEDFSLRNNQIKDIAVDDLGRVWILTLQDLIVLDDQDYYLPFSPEVMGEIGLWEALDFDADGNLWIALGSGVACYHGTVKDPSFTRQALQPSRSTSEQEILYRPEEPKGVQIPMDVPQVIPLLLGISITGIVLAVGGAGLFLLLQRKRTR